MSSVNPLISIITPVFNAGTHIAKCMESVQGQDFRDFEHLIIDGDSSDDTIPQVRDWQKSHPSIRLETGKDQGVYDAMNKGIALARGSWIYFLGADDYLYQPDSLSLMVDFILKTDSQIIYGDVFFQNLRRRYDQAFDIQKILTRNICHQAIFYRADVFKNMGGYNLKYHMEADYDFNLKCWLGGKIQHDYVPVIVAFYAEGGLSSTHTDQLFISDFPSITIAATLNGRWTTSEKINIISKIYRKIVQRPQYTAGEVSKHLFSPPSMILRLVAFMWMCLSSPLYLFRKK